MPFPIYGNLTEAANDCGIPREVLRWAKRNGCRAFTAKRVDVRAFLQWWFERFSTSSPAEAILDYQAERAARERAQRLLLEKKVELLNEGWVRWSDIERWLSVRLILPVTQWMQSAPTAWSHHVNPHNPQEAKVRLEEMMNSLRRLIESAIAPPETEEQQDEDLDVEEEHDGESGKAIEDAIEGPGNGHPREKRL